MRNCRKDKFEGDVRRGDKKTQRGVEDLPMMKCENDGHNNF